MLRFRDFKEEMLQVALSVLCVAVSCRLRYKLYVQCRFKLMRH